MLSRLPHRKVLASEQTWRRHKTALTSTSKVRKSSWHQMSFPSFFLFFLSRNRKFSTLTIVFSCLLFYSFVYILNLDWECNWAQMTHFLWSSVFSWDLLLFVFQLILAYFETFQLLSKYGIPMILRITCFLPPQLFLFLTLLPFRFDFRNLFHIVWQSKYLSSNTWALVSLRFD